MGSSLGNVAKTALGAASFLPGVGGVIGTVGNGLLGAIDSNNAANAANASTDAASANANQFAQLLAQRAQTGTDAYKAFSALQNPLLSEASGLQSGTGANTQALGSFLTQAGLDPTAVQGKTGINDTSYVQNLLGILNNPAQTNLAEGAGTANGHYATEMSQGIDPRFAANAQNQISQNLNRQLADARASAVPGQNVNALSRDLRNNALASSANLAGNLAGQSQTFSDNAVQNFLNNASNLDTQKQGMATSAANAAQAYNQQFLTNAGSSFSTGTSVLDTLSKLLQQGQNFYDSTGSAASSAYGQSAQIAQQAAAGAAQANANAANATSAFGKSLGTQFQPGGLFARNPNAGAGVPDMSYAAFGDGGTTGTQSVASAPAAAAPAPAAAAAPVRQNYFYTPGLFRAPGSNSSTTDYRYDGLNMASGGSGYA